MLLLKDNLPKVLVWEKITVGDNAVINVREYGKIRILLEKTFEKSPFKIIEPIPSFEQRQ
jgi:hypothetical protein